ncbi:MAG: hypothetical protein CFH06_01912 [Alphaproteobacteria bacterium MarineAlpha3_Bin5]|nr:hypothetical protein [Magnetovibrio sp.]PPR75680.1 MAG: hypothetical protein CFH06_01912 [Alphaproteobacteria bacterium MarineAlpha3_Bin5]
MWPYDEIYFRGIHLGRYSVHYQQNFNRNTSSSESRVAVKSFGRNGKNKPIGKIFAAWFKSVFFLLSSYNESIRQKEHLYRLNNHLLNDIGISRSDIESICSGSFCRNRVKENSGVAPLALVIKKTTKGDLERPKKIAA